MRMLKGFVEELGLVGVTRIKAKLQDLLPPSSSRQFLSPILCLPNLRTLDRINYGEKRQGIRMADNRLLTYPALDVDSSADEILALQPPSNSRRMNAYREWDLCCTCRWLFCLIIAASLTIIRLLRAVKRTMNCEKKGTTLTTSQGANSDLAN